MNVEVNNESGVEIDAHGLMRLSRFVMSSLRLHPECELSIKLVDEDTMARYHVEFLDLPGPTDVMSWPMDELRPGSDSDDSEPPLGHLGDIALCPTVAAAQGAKAGHGTWAELELLTVHGILHLLGYDHAEPAEKAEMWEVQGRLLEAWRAPGNRLGEE
ncbi:rRNA maturation RNase YbeY [Kribbella lupini]|jgi:probable rRNA maturation factor|uniref:Endoribonuclease YbeY n=1 Tax=Kribbella lupini TaxID=291602 RepID=A0ABP4KVH2_9ACTN